MPDKTIESDDTPQQDGDLFRAVVADATPLHPRHRRSKSRASAPPLKPRHHAFRQQPTPFADPFAPPSAPIAPLRYVQNGQDPSILDKLKRGVWKVEHSVDLHHMTSDDANQYLSETLMHCIASGVRCLRIVHGKGLNSPQGIPVIKSKLPFWLKQNSNIIAFVESPTKSGGSGAVLVLFKAVTHHNDEAFPL